MQTIPLMDLLQKFIHLWAETNFLKIILTDDGTRHDRSPIFSIPYYK